VQALPAGSEKPEVAIMVTHLKIPGFLISAGLQEPIFFLFLLVAILPIMPCLRSATVLYVNLAWFGGDVLVGRRYFTSSWLVEVVPVSVLPVTPLAALDLAVFATTWPPMSQTETLF